MNALFQIGDDLVCVDQHSAYMNRSVKVYDILIVGNVIIYTVGFPTRFRCSRTGEYRDAIPSAVTTFAVREENLQGVA